MDRNTQNLIGAVFAIAGVITAGASFLNQAESIEKKGLTLTSGIALVGVGLIFLSRLEDASASVQQLSA